MFRPAGFPIFLQLPDHGDDRLIHALHLTVGLSMVGRGSQLLPSVQVAEVCNNMACEGLPLITDEVGRCAKKPEIPNSQSLGCSTNSLILHHIRNNILGEVIL